MKSLRVGSTFSGVEGIGLGLERAGHRVVFQCEADAYRRRVLARHWPRVPCFDDIRGIDCERIQRVGLRGLVRAGGGGDPLPEGLEGDADADRGIDLLCGGFPCQDLSVAGRRAGLQGGERSSLFFEFARVADALLADGGWVLLENVPGLLSSHGGRDFAILLATLAELGFHDLAWRVLDSRYFGVPQRRRRVFVLARRARGRRASEVLLEPEGGGGDFEASRKAGARSSLLAESGAVQALDRKGGGADDNEAQGGHLVAHTLRSEGFDASEDGTGRGTPLVVPDPLDEERAREQRRGSRGLDGRQREEPRDGEASNADRVREAPGVPRRVDVGAYVYEGEAVSIHPDAIGRDGVAKTPSADAEGSVRLRDAGLGINDDGASYTLSTGAPPGVFAEPPEGGGQCAIDLRPDGPRYAACGDAVTVNVAEWIGRRLAEAA